MEFAAVQLGQGWGGSSLPRACVTQVYKVKELLESYGCTVQTSNTETMHARLPNAMRLYEEVLTMHAGETPEKEKLEACIDELRQKDENPEARRGSHAARDLTVPTVSSAHSAGVSSDERGASGLHKRHAERLFPDARLRGARCPHSHVAHWWQQLFGDSARRLFVCVCVCVYVCVCACGSEASKEHTHYTYAYVHITQQT